MGFNSQHQTVFCRTWSTNLGFNGLATPGVAQDGAGRECLEETKGVAHIALSADLASASELGGSGTTVPKWDNIG